MVDASGHQREIRLNADFRQRVLMRAADAAWTPSPAAGVERRMLDRIGGEVARATSVVRYAPGSKFPVHAHEGGEEFFVLEGVFSDAAGDYRAGTYVRNPPGTAHAPWTDGGCILFVKLRQMLENDRALLRIDTGVHPATIEADGTERVRLYEGPDEAVALWRWPAGFAAPSIAVRAGLEIYVLDGAFDDEFGRYERGDWLRLPPGSVLAPRSAEGCRLWTKSGHI